MKKYLPLITIIAVLLISSFVVFNSSYRTLKEKAPIQTEQESKTNTVTLILQYSEGETKTYSEQLKEGMTAFSLLTDITSKESIQVEVKKYDFGTMVESIGGKKNTKKMAWIYFVNGISGDVAADKKILNANDLVEWKYIAPSENSQ